MKYNYFLVLIIAVCIYASYVNIQKSNASRAGTELAAVVNDYVSKTQNNSLADETSLAGRTKNAFGSSNGSQEQTRILEDNSKINTMYDGFGNKTEARCFDNHPRLTCIVLSSAVNGQRRVHVYGQNGDIKELPENMLDKVTTATGDEIANMAGIYATRQRSTQYSYTQTAPIPAVPNSLKMTENSQSSVQNLPAEPVETKNADNSRSGTSASETKTVPATGEVQPKENEKSSASNRPPEEKK